MELRTLGSPQISSHGSKMLRPDSVVADNRTIPDTRTVHVDTRPRWCQCILGNDRIVNERIGSCLDVDTASFAAGAAIFFDDAVRNVNRPPLSRIRENPTAIRALSATEGKAVDTGTRHAIKLHHRRGSAPVNIEQFYMLKVQRIDDMTLGIGGKRPISCWPRKCNRNCRELIRGHRNDGSYCKLLTGS